MAGSLLAFASTHVLIKRISRKLSTAKTALPFIQRSLVLFVKLMTSYTINILPTFV